TLGVGKLLGLFFLLAAICGIFFSIGYSLGKSSGREQALNDQPAAAAASTDTPSSTSSSPKPSAAPNLKQDDHAPTTDDSNSSGQQGSLTFYNAVKQNNNAAPATTSAQTAATPAPKVVEAAATPAPSKSEATRTADVISHTSPVTGPGTIVVQIAAVSREDDAVALAGALRKKNYNVFVVNNPVT